MEKATIVYGEGTFWKTPAILGVFSSYADAVENVVEHSEIPYEFFFGYDAPMQDDIENRYKKLIRERLINDGKVQGAHITYRIAEIRLDEWLW